MTPGTPNPTPSASASAAPIEGAKLPRLVEHDTSFDKPTSFVDINNNREKYADAKTITWPYTSATHLPDDDVLMENPPALLDQAKTIRSCARTRPCASARSAWRRRGTSHLPRPAPRQTDRGGVGGRGDPCDGPGRCGGGGVRRRAGAGRLGDRPTPARGGRRRCCPPTPSRPPGPSPRRSPYRRSAFRDPGRPARLGHQPHTAKGIRRPGGPGKAVPGVAAGELTDRSAPAGPQRNDHAH